MTRGRRDISTLSTSVTVRWLAQFRRLAMIERADWYLLLIGVAIFSGMAALSLLSQNFVYGYFPTDNVNASFFLLMAFAAAVYLMLFKLLAMTKPTRLVLVLCIGIGFVSRLIFFESTPMFENDWYRYLWDGAVLGNGGNPYAFTPNEVLSGTNTDELGRIRQIGAHNEHFPERVAYGHLTTIYPPIAQLSFALSYFISPFDLDAFRTVLLLADACALGLLLLLLTKLNKDPAWVLLYWWNPIVILNVFNAGHMDTLMAPFLIGSLLLVLHRRPHFAALALAGAAGVKLWPVILAPLLFRHWRGDLRTLITVGLVLITALCVIVGPMVFAQNVETSGLSAFSTDWQKNSFLFPLLSAIFDLFATDFDYLTRGSVAAIVMGYIAYQSFGPPDRQQALGWALITAVSLLFFLAPTGYPWYSVWIFIFLPIAPSFGLACLTLTLPIYYLRFYFDFVDRSGIFNSVLVPIEFGVPLMVLALSNSNWRKRVLGAFTNFNARWG